MDNDKVFKECGPGWNILIDPLIVRCTGLGGTVDQIKEKYGTLSFYYTPCGPASDALWNEFQDAVDEAERHSRHMCELCGARAVLMIKGSWYKTLCREHSLELGYKEKA
jgi:hypothetical protein